MANASRDLPTPAQRGNILAPALAILAYVGADRSIVAFAKKAPGASLADFWARAPRGLWLLHVVLMARVRARTPREAADLAALHERAGDAWRESLLAGEGETAAANRLRLAASPIDWPAMETILTGHRTDGPFAEVYGDQTAFAPFYKRWLRRQQKVNAALVVETRRAA